MELVEVLRTTGAIRDFTDEPVPDEVVFRILDTARFGPSGGNVQGWRVVVVKDRATRRTLRSSSMRLVLVWSRPAVSASTRWAPRAAACCTASNTTAPGSPPSLPRITVAPTRSDHISN